MKPRAVVLSTLLALLPLAKEIATLDVLSGGRVILGIGVNLAQTAFPPALADRATSLRLVTGRLRSSFLAGLDRLLDHL